MIAWWESMDLIQQIFAVTAIAATVLLIIQVIMMLFGLGDSNADAGSPDSTFTSDVHLPGDAAPPQGWVPPPSLEITTGDIQIDVPKGNADINIDPGDFYGDATDAAPAHAASGIHLFTLQGFVAFFAVFGWSGLAMLKAAAPAPAAIVAAVILGLLAMYILAVIYKVMLKLQQDGSKDIKYALGKTASVYIPIPAKRSQAGKVSVMVGDQLMELDAVTDEDKPISTGREVTVIGVSNNMTLIVRSK